ncbi:regulator of telomere elongation helicase 1 [Protopterus annectens]|uniref:regulator of telomere elongation helicase 1 n=1 Tax=Protopterus annectens TaxID=7888 RepID=UPI001CFAB20C|nr:regulator of telomere elongation helicase 1 [Protopterus annectens]
MPKLLLNGITVDFPFSPYKCQEDYMSKVIECLQRKVNGVLESPTGTGKTLCLLCATLAWRECFRDSISARKIAEKMHGEDLFPERPLPMWGNGSSDCEVSVCYTDVPKIIYASRTHSQLSQVINELKNTSYRPKMCILGSREQLCVNTEVMKQENSFMKIHLCRTKVTSRACPFYNNVEEKSTEKTLTDCILDIEDLVKNGIKQRACPYFLSRALKQQADIIFMPYNYLLDPKSRRAHSLDLKGAVVIFDEAHNVEKMCEESSSFDLTPYDLATGIDAVNMVLEERAKTIQETVGSEFVLEGTSSVGLNLELSDLAKIKQILLDLECAIDTVEVPSNGYGTTKPGSFIFDLFAQAKITFQTKSSILEALELITQFLADRTGVFTSISGLQKLMDIIQIVFNVDPEECLSSSAVGKNISKYYKVHIHLDHSSQKKKSRSDLWTTSITKKQGKILSYWCFSPGFSMHEIIRQGVRCVILTSGTLSPLSSFTSEMQISFPVSLENPHVIDRHQIWVGIFPKGPDGIQLSSAYDRRFTTDYMSSLGKTLINIGRVVPHGLLVFFPSYPVMEKTLEHWKDTSLSKRIEEVKSIFVETKGKGSFTEMIDGYYEKIADPESNGAAFLAVCRGKASEGLDFADMNGRGVIITGLPFPPRMDPKVVLKMQYLDELRGKTWGGMQYLSGQEWYRQQALRAVNQAIGRVIRHQNDYGAIFLCDHRFTNTDAIAHLSLWIRPFIKIYDNFGHAIRDVSQFFRTVQKVMPLPKVKAVAGSDSMNTSHGVSSLSSVPLCKSVGLKEARTVISHVKSLKRKSSDIGDLCCNRDGLNALWGEYALNRALLKRKPASLLDALEHTERRMGQEGAEAVHGEEKAMRVSTLSLQHDKRLADEQKGGKKKIKLVQNHDEEFPMPVEHTKVGKATFFMAAVQKALSQANYECFTKIMHKYKNTDDFDSMLSEMASLFIEDPKKHILLREFYQFIRPHHKKQYDEACCSLTGKGCGYRPEHSLSKEERETLTQQQQQKGTGNITDTADTKFVSAENSVKQLNTSVHLNKGLAHLDQSVQCRAEKSKPANPVTKSKPEVESCSTQGGKNNSKAVLAAYLSDVKKALEPNDYSRFSAALQAYKKADNYNVMVAEVVSLFTENAKDINLLRKFCMFVRPHHQPEFLQVCKELTEMNSTSSVDGNTSVREEDVQPESSTIRTEQESIDYDKAGYQCVSCRNQSTVPFKCQTCDFTCCKACWENCLKEVSKCPKCQAATKKRHLFQVFFTGRNQNIV